MRIAIRGSLGVVFVGLTMMVGCAVSTPEPTDGQSFGEESSAVERQFCSAVKHQFCGGIAGIQCKNPNEICIDDPNDNCDPNNGGADCGGICVKNKKHCNDPNRTYVSRDPQQCQVIKFFCVKGEQPFSDECGCGCEPVTKAKLGEHCGGNITGALECEDGLVCFGGPLVGDVGGTCMKPVAEGGSCGFRVQTSPCADGLDCVHVAGTPLDALTCVARKAQFGQHCGGNIMGALECEDGLVCSGPGPVGDIGGTCACPGMQHWCPSHVDASGTCNPGYCLFAGAMCLIGKPCAD
jgi:hypothetical protein